MIYKINFTKHSGDLFYINNEYETHKLIALSPKLETLYEIFLKYFHHDTNILLDVSITSLISFDKMLLMLNSNDTTIFNMAIDIIKNTKIYDNQDNRNI